MKGKTILRRFLSAIFAFGLLIHGASAACAEEYIQVVLQSGDHQLEISAPISNDNPDAVRFSLIPSAIEMIPLLLEKLFENDSDLQNLSDEFYIKYAVMNPNPQAGQSDYIKSLGVSLRDQHVNYLEVDKNINGDVVAYENSKYTKLLQSEAIDRAAKLLAELGMQRPTLVKAETCENAAAQKGFYHLVYTSSYYNRNFVDGHTSHHAQYPLVSCNISEEGIFSLNGKFLYRLSNKVEQVEIMPVVTLIPLIEPMLDIVMYDAAPLPIESITLENYSVIEEDGSFNVFPVWVLRSDESKMTGDFLKEGLHPLCLILNAESGELISF